MSSYQVAHLQDIEVIDDGRCPMRPVRHHFGITTFGVTTWTAGAAGDRLINEHDETDVFHSGEYARAADWVTERLESGELSPSATLLYNLACAESQAGRVPDAIRHLGRSIEMDDQFRGLAAKDSDFDPLRDDPGFQALVRDSAS